MDALEVFMNSPAAKILYVILGALFTIALTLATFSLNGVNAAIVNQEERLYAHERETASENERLAKLEARYDTIQVQLDRIERKLDGRLK